jgi:prepilin-type N-terminal cleavage/methylation domain-containing protein
MAAAPNRGFTLIELLIVIGIIAVLVVVLAFAVFPFIARSDVSATKTMLTNVGTGLPANPKVLDLKQFRTHAGPTLGSKIDPDPRKASSQMLLFYLAPSQEVWRDAKLYERQSYNPPNQPESFAEFTDGTGLPWLVDRWNTPLWYDYDPTVKAGYIMSAGPDKIWKTEDDLIFDPKSESVKERREMTK